MSFVLLSLPFATGDGTALLVLDVSEHAYYVDFRNRRADFAENFLNRLANPRGTIQTVVLDDGRALTDFRSIALWLAERHPRGKLLPEDPALAARAIELLDFALFQLHGEGFTRIFTTERYLSAADAQQGRQLHEDVAAHYQRVRARPVVRQVLAEEGYRT